MESIRRLLASINNNNRLKEKQESSSFLENGSMLLEGLIVSWNGRCDNPLRSFSAEEVTEATNNFDSQHEAAADGYYVVYVGSLGSRTIFVKKYGNDYSNWDYPDDIRTYAIRDIVITTQMSSHNNVLKLIGCCLEFKFPALVYEYAGHGYGVLSDLISIDDGRLSWKNRLRIANGIANAVLYLHTAFPRSIIHRNLKPGSVIIDQFGVAKLFDFSFSIAIPDGESRVEDNVCGTFGFLDPEYARTGFVTEKSDVYGIGVLLLELLIGKNSKDVGLNQGLVTSVKDHVDGDQWNEIVDPRILGEAGPEKEQQMQAFLALALKCTDIKGDDRPEMSEVATELRRIERSIHPS